MEKKVPTRIFGRTGEQVTCVGLGGEGILRTYGRDRLSLEVLNMAEAEGIRYFDSAQAYAGSESYYGSFWPANKALRENALQTSKSASRDKLGALRDLQNSLKTMQLSTLDLWQIHDVRTENDLRLIESPGGALEAFLEAKDQGLVRFIGVTGHQDPAILTQALQRWPVDAVLLPVNPVEGVLGGFLDMTLPSAREKGIAVIGMKILGASRYIFPEAGITPQLLIQYALSCDIDVAIVGCSTPSEVKLLAEAGRSFTPLSEEQKEEIHTLFRPHAKKLAFYTG